jgi:hypothetical protein
MDRQRILYWGDRLIVVLDWNSWTVGVVNDRLGGGLGIHIGPLVVAVRRTYRPFQKLQK